VDLVKNFKNLIVTRTFSKGFGLASIRFGYVCADEGNIALINKIKNQKEVSSFAQRLAVVALENIDSVNKRIDKINQNKKMFCELLKKSKITFRESEANFILIRTKNHDDVLRELLNKNILVRDRSYLNNLEGCIRVTIGEKEDMIQVLKTLEKNNE
jgi:histidinol-phosphate aminotransferase